MGRPTSTRCVFGKEARHGESVLARTQTLGSDAGRRFAHELRAPGDRLRVRALTRSEPSP